MARYGESPERREKRILKEKIALQQELLAEADAEAYFSRHGRDSMRQLILEEQLRQKLDRIKCYCNPWDEFHRQYERDVEKGGTVITREADSLADHVMAYLLAGREPEGKLVTNCMGVLNRYHIDWERYPLLALLELSVYIYAVLTGQVSWYYYSNPFRNQWKPGYGEGKAKGYWAKGVADRQQQEHLMNKNGRHRLNWGAHHPYQKPD